MQDKIIWLTTIPVLHEIQCVEDIKVLSFGKHLGISECT